jgi:ABC-type polysaccharide/polyol phosphate export permease
VLAPVRETWNHRSVIRHLTERELRAKYKKSFLGWVWSLLNPLATLVIYTIVFGTFLKIKPPVGGNGDLRSFALYLFAALVMWNFFGAVVNGSMVGMTAAGPLIRKVYLPPECIVFSIMGAAVLQTLVEAGILATIMIIVGNVSWTFLLFPYLLLMLVLFSVGVAMVTSLLNVYYRDVGYLVAIGMNFLFYATPIVYTITIVPKDVNGIPARAIIEANPMTQFVQASRDLFYELQVPSLWRVAYTTAWSVGMFAVGWWIFSRRAGDIAEEL